MAKTKKNQKITTNGATRRPTNVPSQIARPMFIEVKDRSDASLFLETAAVCSFSDLGRNQTRVMLRSGHTLEIQAPYESFKAFMTGNLSPDKPKAEEAPAANADGSEVADAAPAANAAPEVTEA